MPRSRSRRPVVAGVVSLLALAAVVRPAAGAEPAAGVRTAVPQTTAQTTTQANTLAPVTVNPWDGRVAAAVPGYGRKRTCNGYCRPFGEYARG